MADDASRIEIDRNAEGHGLMGDEFVPGETVSEDTAPETGPAVSTEPARRRWRKPLLLIAPIILIVGALAFYLHGGRYETTDNAYLQSGLVSVSPNVPGRVVAVAVRNNQHVRKGDLLFQLDPAPFKAEVAEAQAQLAAAVTAVGSLRANYAQGASELATARTRVLFAEREAARQKQLVGEGISSQAQYDQAQLAAQTARQAIQTTQQQNASVQAQLSGDVNAPLGRQPGVQRAQAALDRARLNLGYTVIRAAQDGIVAKVDQLQVGDYVTVARPVFSLAGTRIWVEANFKEDQLRYMRLGQPATVKIDAFPDQHLTARVTSFSPGTGNSFSVLPAENATGNWVKVVQRLPVELTLDRIPTDVPLHAGLSVEVDVDTGHVRHLFGADTPPSAPPPAQPSAPPGNAVR
ncbi:HlyD family secretion protein [Sphingomonas sp. CROZ-RG-20F-R02-07]|uniref:HlyD family secretion protein n=1 Tax=Sphingomonas sp. CROZ-RG-20F-R02-07 TaxID=2914832 RepID=UPI001F592C2B|nr:HlyD family secretion protein [Sphingomonas sp. CROZ-RG-20F-R02-07]